MEFIIDSPKYGKHTVLIDDEDWEKVNKYVWHVSYHHNGKIKTVSTNEKGTQLKLHKFLTGYTLTDHIDGNPLNNQKENLRECTQQKNTWNAALSKRNKTGFKGVYWEESRKKYQAYIKIGDKKKHLGRYVNASDAARAYNKAAIENFGEFARLNEI